MMQAAPPEPHLVPAPLQSGGERAAAVDVLQRRHQGPEFLHQEKYVFHNSISRRNETTYLGGEETILSLGNL